jgi:5'-3' exonuclease
VKVHLIDGTYELFRAFYGAPSHRTAAGVEVGALRGLARSLLALIAEPGVTHVAIAFDHVIESFRNALYAGYKTGAGIDPELRAQFEPAEALCRALGFVTWPMVEFEADDALATAAGRYAEDARVETVIIASPDKDLAQCVRADRVVCLDRRRGSVLDAAGVRAKFGVDPESIPDWLALVGDSADGFPGIPRWGAKSAAAVLGVYRRLEDIPADVASWTVSVRGASALAENLATHRGDALLFRTLATLRTDAPIVERLDALAWRGPEEAALRDCAREMEDRSIVDRATSVAADRAGGG